MHVGVMRDESRIMRGDTAQAMSTTWWEMHQTKRQRESKIKLLCSVLNNLQFSCFKKLFRKSMVHNISVQQIWLVFFVSSSCQIFLALPLNRISSKSFASEKDNLVSYKTNKWIVHQEYALH